MAETFRRVPRRQSYWCDYFPFLRALHKQFLPSQNSNQYQRAWFAGFLRNNPTSQDTNPPVFGEQTFVFPEKIASILCKGRKEECLRTGHWALP